MGASSRRWHQLSEQEIQQRIRLALSKGDTRLFRNNVGVGWTGAMERRGSDVILRKARPLHAGLAPGSADLIGWKSIVITEDMVGQVVAVFCSLEIKSQRGKLRPDQEAWLNATRAAGGLAGVARSTEDAAGILDTILGKRNH